MPSGEVETSDPFVTLGEGVVAVAPDEYPVRVTVADMSDERDGSHRREAYLSLALSDRPPVAAELARDDGDGVYPVVARSTPTGTPPAFTSTPSSRAPTTTRRRTNSPPRPVATADVEAQQAPQAPRDDYPELGR